ncbi:MAG: hypothetical protein A2X94_12630 [Bdellovibrionales bacterium GWB1_55_8]|nr:MAG: hypothetical protein A2X94_12630 [Bdellovibrionales bacterium GWB1_55_8]
MRKFNPATALFLIALSFVGASGCASGPKARIVQTEKEILNSIGTAREEPDARLEAIEVAQDYCERRGRETVFEERGLQQDPDKDDGIDPKKIPVIGKVFKGSDKSQVVLSFRCVREKAA